MVIESDCDITDIVLLQLGSFWLNIDADTIRENVPYALSEMETNYDSYSDMRYLRGGDEVLFSPYISTQWMIFLYRLSRRLFLLGKKNEADQVYYLNKIMHSIDWLYAVDLPPHFFCEHPHGSVLGRAKYGDFFFINQGVTVGGNYKNGICFYPKINENVTMFANATVLGNSIIGKNVIVAANTYLIDETIPDNCLVFGKSPEITINEKSESYMIDYIRMQRGWT